MNVGILVTSQAREIIGNETLKSFFDNSKDLAYIAEIGDYIYQDLRDNGVRALVIIGDVNDTIITEIENKTGIIPLAIDIISMSWITEKSKKFVNALISAYISKASLSMLAYRVQPVHSKSLSRRSLLKIKLYEYIPYPVLADQLKIEKEINKVIESCPKGLIIRTPEGPQVSKIEECVACGYCSGSSYLGYLENPTLSTYQFISFVNSIVKNYGPAKLLFSCSKVDIKEGVFPIILPIGYLHDSLIYSAYAAGLEPIIYVSETCKHRDVDLKRFDEIPSHFPGTDLPIFKAKTEEELTKLFNTPVYLTRTKEIPEDLAFSRTRKRSLLIWSIREMMKDNNINNLEDEVPSTYYVSIDTEKCVLCGVCVRSCQMLVPQIKNQGEILTLEYDEYNCIGSGRCVKSCPENAITLVNNAKIKDLQKITFTRAKIIKCRYCGKPIGSMKVKDKVSDILNSKGYNTSFVDVCNDCKQKMLTKMWLERFGERK
jgi:ferredoxin